MSCHVIPRRIGGLENSGVVTGGLGRVPRRIGGLEIVGSGCYSPDGVPRRIGGLENGADRFRHQASVPRRIGGLEMSSQRTCRNSLVPRRIGGLESYEIRFQLSLEVPRRIGGLARLCTKSSTSTRPRPENFVCGDFVPSLLKGKNDSSEVPTTRYWLLHRMRDCGSRCSLNSSRLITCSEYYCF